MKKSGIELIAEERQRHLHVKGWTIEHDLQHSDGELVDAAICYAMTTEDRKVFKKYF